MPKEEEDPVDQSRDQSSPGVPRRESESLLPVIGFPALLLEERNWCTEGSSPESWRAQVACAGVEPPRKGEEQKSACGSSSTLCLRIFQRKETGRRLLLNSFLPRGYEALSFETLGPVEKGRLAASSAFTRTGTMLRRPIFIVFSREQECQTSALR